jgi:hypothetical protein
MECIVQRIHEQKQDINIYGYIFSPHYRIITSDELMMYYNMKLWR